MESKMNYKEGISIVIPCWEYYNGDGLDLLKFNLEKIFEQTYKNFNILIGDQSNNSAIEDYIKNNKFPNEIYYFDRRKTRGRPEFNTNYLLKNADRQYIKILFQDDFLFGVDALEKGITHAYENQDSTWFIWPRLHLHTADKIVAMPGLQYYTDQILFGNNTLGNPSVLMIKNANDIPLFENSLDYLVHSDCIYYEFCFRKYGPPAICNNNSMIGVRIWENSISGQRNITPSLYEMEHKNIKNNIQNLFDLNKFSRFDIIKEFTGD